jgi:ABC-2 type transport system ATP-binding protein
VTTGWEHPVQDAPVAADAGADRGIHVRRLVKRFGLVEALRGVDLDVAPGEVVVLLGPNGAGKSTLLRILATSTTPDGGRAVVAGRDVALDPAGARRSVGMVLGDERSWYWRLDGRRNLEFFAAVAGLGRRRASARAAEVLTDFALTAVADRRVDRYSSGMRARLSLARAVLAQPAVLLLDEPSRSLDPVSAADARAHVRRQAEGGRAILFATHDLHEAASLADRVVVLASGTVAAVEDTPVSPSRLEEILLGVAGR